MSSRGYNTYTGATTINVTGSGWPITSVGFIWYANNLVPGTSVVNIKAGGTLDLGGVGTGQLRSHRHATPPSFQFRSRAYTLQNGVINYTAWGNFDTATSGT